MNLVPQDRGKHLLAAAPDKKRIEINPYISISYQKTEKTFAEALDTFVKLNI
jgi:hypothetical protein